MRAPLGFIRKRNRRQSLGLITIGLTMLVCSQLAEAIDHRGTREIVQLVIILSGVAASAKLFRTRGSDTQK